MKIKICCDNNANAQSKRFDIVELGEIGLSEEEWNAMDDAKKYVVARDYVYESGLLDIWYEEVEATHYRGSGGKVEA